MTVSILICTFGAPEWSELSWSRAYPSAVDQDALEVLVNYAPDGTLAYSRNAAAAEAIGDWLCFLDADDELAPGYLAAMERAYLTHAAWAEVLLAPALSRGPEGGWTEPRIPNIGGWPRVNECVVGTLVPRPLFLEVGGFRELPSLEDYDLWLRCVKAGARIVHVPAAVYREHVSVAGRNRDQSIYHQLVAEHHEVFA